MRKNIFWLLWVGLFIASCGNSAKEGKADLNDKKAELQKLKGEQKKINDKVAALEAEIAKLDPKAGTGAAKLVTATTLGTGNFSHYIELQGRIDATNISYVAPPNGQGGVVTALYVTQGQSVRKGQVIAKLDDQLVRQQIEPLRVQLATAEDTYRRLKNLFDQGVGSSQNVLTAKTQVETLQKQIGIIQKQASLYTVTAPQSGVIDQLNLRVGEILTAMQTPQTAQIRIVNTGDLKITAAVPENYLGRVNTGSRLLVILPEQNNDSLNATVSVVQKVIDPNTRSFNIEARIPTKGNLKPNQVALVRILDYTASNTIIVPLNVIQSDEKGKYVYVMEKDGERMVARKKTVLVGESYGTGIEVKSGLKAGDQLITEGYLNLYEGQVVTVAQK